MRSKKNGWKGSIQEGPGRGGGGYKNIPKNKGDMKLPTYDSKGKKLNTKNLILTM